MTREEAIAIIRNEYLCVDNDCDIGESCSECPYVMPTKEPILEAYNVAIKALSAIGDIKAEIEFERDRKIGGEFFEAVQYKSFNKCLEIIDKHIGG